MPVEKEQQEFFSKFNPLLASGVRILMTHTLPCFFKYTFILLWVTIFSFDAMLFIHKFQCLSKQGITLFLLQKTGKKKLREVIQWPQSRIDLDFLNARSTLHLPQEDLPMNRQCHMGWEPKACTKLWLREWTCLLGFLWCWIACLQTLFRSQEFWSSSWKEKYSTW